MPSAFSNASKAPPLYEAPSAIAASFGNDDVASRTTLTSTPAASMPSTVKTSNGASLVLASMTTRTSTPRATAAFNASDVALSGNPSRRTNNCVVAPAITSAIGFVVVVVVVVVGANP